MGTNSAPSANDEMVKFPVESSNENKTSDSSLNDAFETLFHMSGVKEYLEYYELR